MTLTDLDFIEQTLIAWAHDTVNPWLGCNEVSRECEGCYVKQDMTNKKLNFHAVRRTSPAQWQKARNLNEYARARGKSALVFTCSYSDFFHPAADPWRPKFWQTIRECPNLIWLIVTKRPERIAECLPEDWGDDGYPNVWLGTTVGVRASYHRLDHLRRIRCKLRFVSIEPLLESLHDIDLTDFSWILVGGMSGSLWEQRKMDLSWAAELYEQSRRTPGLSYFFKQSSAPRSERGIDGLGRYLNLKDEADRPKLFRAIPATPLPLLPLDVEKGHRFTDREWQRYQLPRATPVPTDPSTQLFQIPGQAEVML